MKTTNKSKQKLYTAIDLHSGTCVIGTMNEAGESSEPIRFDTSEENLRTHVDQVVKEAKKRKVILTIESAPLARWCRDIVKPLVDQVIVCDPRKNYLISRSSNKNDELDVSAMCTLLRMGALKEVWQGDCIKRQMFRESVLDLLKLRDQQRKLKTLIKTRYRGFGIVKINGKEIFHPEKRSRWLGLIPEKRSTGVEKLYFILDSTLSMWNDQLREVNRQGLQFPEIGLFQQIPGIGDMGSAVFCAIIEDPHRFKSVSALYRYSSLGITNRTSDNKPLGYERIDRWCGNRELKNLSYHGWRTGIRIGKQSQVVREFYEASKIRTGSVRHARLNTQRKLLGTMLSMWKHNRDFDPNTFLQTPEPEPSRNGRRRRRRRRYIRNQTT